LSANEPSAPTASPPDHGASRRRLSLAVRDALLGVALGTCAPAGAFLLRWALGAPDAGRELRNNAFFYAYELVGTCAVFGVAGFFEGRRADRLRRGRDRFRILAERDELTELPNRRSFQSHLRRVAARSRRFGEPLALLFIDVDQLKKINDRFGHPAGSAALLHVANSLRASKREEDMAARWGGDEFVLLMPGAGPDAAGRVAASILHRLNSRPLPFGGGALFVTVTIGVAAGPPPANAEELFRKADEALYAGKRAGRNCVRTAGTGSPGSHV
jgi:diguanylate cyclase (GGDEF)-like protein